MNQETYVGNTPTVTDVIEDGRGQAIPLDGTVAFVYRPSAASGPVVSVPATIDPDQVTNEGVVRVQLVSPFADAPMEWTWWWHVVFANGTILDTDNFTFTIKTHGPGSGTTPYLTPGLFRRLTRVKMSRLGIAASQDAGDELLQTELDRAAAYVEFVTGQPATAADLLPLTTNNGTATTRSTATLIKQAIQMRTEQVTFQAQNGYVDDASDDVTSSLSVGGFSQSKSDPGRRGEQRQLNSWQALSNLLWLLMTPERYYWWVVFLSGDAHLMIGPEFGFENTFEPSWGGWGYGYGLADQVIGRGYGSMYGGLDGNAGIGGWQGNLGGLPGGFMPLEVD